MRLFAYMRLAIAVAALVGVGGCVHLNGCPIDDIGGYERCQGRRP